MAKRRLDQLDVAGKRVLVRVDFNVPIDQGIEITPAALFTVSGKKLMGCVLGSVNSLYEIPRMVALWQAGRLDLEGLITGRRPLEEINEAMDDLRASRGIRTVLSI